MQSVLHNLIFFTFLLLAGNCFSQPEICGTVRLQMLEDSSAQVDAGLFDDPEISAEFPGGRVALKKFIAENLKYPSSGICISGKCYMRFTIEEDGKVTNVKIIRGVPDCPECNAEALRVVNLMPNWIPAMLVDKPVKSYFDMSISFSISDY